MPLSTFTPYDQVSAHYDSTRIPVGTEIMLGCLAGLGQPLGEVSLLDAGCGTGAYSDALLGHVGRIDAIDLSPGMLATARAKLGASVEAGRIAFHQGSITELPFETGRFDAVMTNQVLHHLDDGENPDFPVLRQAVAEFARVLRPGGGLVINTCSRDQLLEAYWFWRLAPGAGERYCRRVAPLETLEAMLADAGLVHRGRFVPADALSQGEAYFNGEGPLDETWRNGDSFWAALSGAELEEAQARVRALAAEGRLADFVAEHDRARPNLGQITFVFATRAGVFATRAGR